MRLSDIKGEASFEVLADLLEPVCNIAADEEASGIFKKEKLPEGMTPKAFLLQRIKSHAPALIRNHKDDLTAIFAALNQTTPEEYSKTMTLLTLPVELMELFADDEFIRLFTSVQTQDGSGSAMETTEAVE